ncbi:hypothetical protein AB0H00_09360 [Nocardia sp. NPDC023852]|uniref:hypothetical protein n=1 Tax=Nocardia sp. NPDC023852 TaxID=3154697 RepID=UPI0033D684E4
MTKSRIGAVLGAVALLAAIGVSASGTAAAAMTCEEARANLNRAQADLQYARSHLNKEGIGRAEAAVAGAEIAKTSACR